MLHSRIDVVSYDPRWPDAFEKAADEVRGALGTDLVAIHYITDMQARALEWITSRDIG